MDRFFCFLCLIALAASLGGNAGCSRQHYRKKADQEVYSVLRQGNTDPRWKVNDYRITPDAASRMYDPYNPDREPMPTDDPAAHRKMQSAGGMKGSRNWYEHGCTSHVENPRWRQYLLVNEKGEIPLDKDKAVELARLHASDYQSRLEDLYLAAMGVSRERYRFDVQFLGSNDLTYKAAGENSSTLTNNAKVGASRRLATGATWVVEAANKITWTLTGSGSWDPSTVISASVTQPLLRGAGRKIVLEELTQRERNFLTELRKMVLFQQGHYTRLVTGSTPQLRDVSIPGGSGFYQLLEQQILIQNQRQNIIGLEDSLNRFIELFDAGQSELIQVEETRQTLLNAQSRLVGQINEYQSRVEGYVRSLGLPPDLKVSISDPLLEQFQLTSPTLTVLMEEVGGYLAIMREKNRALPENFREATSTIVRRAAGEISILNQDLDMLQKSMPDRIASLQSLESVLAERIAGGERIAPEVYDTATFTRRVEALRNEDIPRNLARLQASFTLLNLIAETEEETLREMIRNPHTFDTPVQEALQLLNLGDSAGADADAHLSAQQQELAKIAEQLDALQDALQEALDIELPQAPVRDEPMSEAERVLAELRQRDGYRDWVHRAFSVFQNELVTLSLMQTRTRLQAMTLMPVSVTPEEAFQTASEHRLDWMNQRSELVDAWRQIDFTADRLKGFLSLRFDGNLGTADGSGVKFSKNNSDLSVTLNWDSPLNRYDQMMDYRASQIDYQRARRAYYTYVDSVQAELRNTLRNVQMNQINFEINRNTVLVGTIRVDVMQLRLEQPPQRGARIDTNASQQLINALDGLTNSQNDLLRTWVAYQTQRMLLDCYMGTMTLDERGRWVDPGIIGSSPHTIRELPLAVPIPVPIIETPRLNRRYVEE